MTDTTQTTLAEFEKGDEIVFNDRKQPLTVSRVHDGNSSTTVYVEGPRGGSYKLIHRDWRGESTVERDVCDYENDSEWVRSADLESVELVTPAAEVEPPVEVGDDDTDVDDVLGAVDEGDRLRIAYDSPQADDPVEREGDVVSTSTTAVEMVLDDDDPDERRVKLSRRVKDIGRYDRPVKSALYSAESDFGDWVHGSKLGGLVDAERIDVDAGDDDDDPDDGGRECRAEGCTGGARERSSYCSSECSPDVDLSPEGGDNDPDSLIASADDGPSPVELRETESRDDSHANVVERQLAMADDYDPEADKPMGERVGEGGQYGDPVDDEERPVPAGVEPEPDDDDDVATDGGISAVEHFSAYISGVLELDALPGENGSASIVKASRSALVDARDELRERGYECELVEHPELEPPRLVVIPDDDDLAAVLDALDDGIPEPGEGLDVDDPVDRADDDEPEPMTDGGVDERELVEVPVTIHKNPQGLHLWIDDDVGIDVELDVALDGGIERIEREVFGRLPDETLDVAERELTPESKREALGRDAPTVAVAEYFPETRELGGVALSLGPGATAVLFPKGDAGDDDDEPEIVTDGGVDVVGSTSRSTSWNVAERIANELDDDDVATDGGDRHNDGARGASAVMVDETEIEERAAELADVTDLSKREAEVWAWKERTDLTHEEIGERIGLAKSSVDELSRRARQKDPIETALARARRTLDVLDDVEE